MTVSVDWNVQINIIMKDTDSHSCTRFYGKLMLSAETAFLHMCQDKLFLEIMVMQWNNDVPLISQANDITFM